MGALLWLNAGTLERVLTPQFGRLVRCYAHGCFFMRLQYVNHSVLNPAMHVSFGKKMLTLHCNRMGMLLQAGRC